MLKRALIKSQYGTYDTGVEMEFGVVRKNGYHVEFTEYRLTSPNLKPA